MSTIKELKSHMSSVNETHKITNAMYLISSTKLQKAKTAFNKNAPYFKTLRNEIERLFETIDEVDSIYFTKPGTEKIKGTNAYLVVTADRGLAGAYNQNVIKETMRLLRENDDNLLFVVGEYGRHFFNAHNIPIEKSFMHTAQNPTLYRARQISEILLESYQNRDFQKLYIIYTDYTNDVDKQVVSTRLLPFEHEYFTTDDPDTLSQEAYEFYPSPETVLENIMPYCIVGFIYSALVDSFCSEQYFRMTAMDAANTNAQHLMDELSAEYNHVRQSVITQEITEISSGAKKTMRR